MSQYDIKGGNAIIETDVLGDMLPLVCVKSFSVNVVAKLKETTTEGNGLWEDWDYDRMGFTITINGLVQIFGEDGQPTFYDLYDRMLQFLEIGIRLLYLDNSGNPAITTCTVIMENKVFDANPIKLLNSSVVLRGKGELVTHKPDEVNTITFNLNGSVFVADQQLAAVDNCYRVSNSLIMSTSNESSQQDLEVTFRLPKINPDFASDYNSPVTVGLLNGNMSPVTAVGSYWEITYTFDYVPATLNKSFSITEI